MAQSTPTATARQREETVLSFHPSWRGMLGWYCKWLLIALAVGAIAYALKDVHVLSTFIFVVITFVALVIVFAVGHLIRLMTTYLVTNRRVSETSGVLTRRTESAFFPEITNTTVQRSLSERMLHIGHLDFDTAGERLITQQLAHRSSINTSFLSWWGVVDPYGVAAVVDGLRYGDDIDDIDDIDDADTIETGGS
jgi:membrane protein YdbS with pleckstrin-like domain